MNPRLLPISAFFLFSAVLLSGSDVTLRTERGDIAAATRKIQVRNPLGNVVVKAAPDGFGWEWNLRRSHETDGDKEDAQQWRVEARQEGDLIAVVVVRPDGNRDQLTESSSHRLLSVLTFGLVADHHSSLHSDLVLRVPVASAVDVANRWGTVHVEGTQGAVGVDNRLGTVELQDLPGAINARTAFGRIQAKHIGPARLTGGNGSVEVEGVAGELEAMTSFSSLQVRDVKGGALLRNQSGGIAAKDITGEVNATTSFGNIRLEKIRGRAFVKNQSGRVELVDIGGAIAATNTFGPLVVRGAGAEAELHNQNGGIEATRVTGALTAVTSFGSVRVEQIGGAADLDCRNGRIEAQRVTGDLRAVSSFAPIKVSDVGGAATLTGQNGDIAANGIGGDIRADTSFGRIHLDGRGRTFVAHCQNGGVEIVARSPDVQRIEANASFASIHVRLPEQTKPAIRAATSFGRVESDFPVTLGPGGTTPFPADAPLKVSLQGQNGNIRVERFAAQ